MPPDALIAFYPCFDLSATHDFYARDLGLELARDQGSCRIYRVSRGGYLGFCQHDTRLAQHPGLILTLVTDDVEGFYRRLKRVGAETEAPPRTHPRFGIHHFFARDPDGYRVEVQRFLAPLE